MKSVPAAASEIPALIESMNHWRNRRKTKIDLKDDHHSNR